MGGFGGEGGLHGIGIARDSLIPLMEKIITPIIISLFCVTHRLCLCFDISYSISFSAA